MLIDFDLAFIPANGDDEAFEREMRMVRRMLGLGLVAGGGGSVDGCIIGR
jgi:hypothetical protein